MAEVFTVFSGDCFDSRKRYLGVIQQLLISGHNLAFFDQFLISTWTKIDIFGPNLILST